MDASSSLKRQMLKFLPPSSRVAANRDDEEMLSTSMPCEDMLSPLMICVVYCIGTIIAACM